MASPTKRCIAGIDLGTTNSLIAVNKAARAEAVANDQSERLTPSVVRLVSPRIFGKFARDYIKDFPKQTIYGVKRLMGRKWSDSCVQTFKNNVSFDIYNKGGYPVIRGPEGTEDYTPEQISAMILGSLKTDAETLVEKPVNDAVITVPAAFNESQRMATKQAGMIAGFSVVAVINEPTAAALQWLHENNLVGTEKTILVFDMGGGTTDVSIVSSTKDSIRVTSTTGDTELGGDDIDQLLVDHFVKEIKENHGCDLRQIPSKLIDLRNACLRIKHQLSASDEVEIRMDNLVKNTEIVLSMRQGQFKRIINELIGKVIALVQKALKLDLDFCGNPVDITDIVLVGGSSRMPWVKNMFLKSIHKDEHIVHRNTNCDEVVATGAAIYASILSGSNLYPDIKVLDIAPLTYGIEVEGGKLAPIVTQGSSLPVSCQRIFTTAVDMQRSVLVQIYEGSSEDKRKLEEFELRLTNLAEKGVPDIAVTFSLSQDFLLSVKAFEVSGTESMPVEVVVKNLHDSNLIRRMRRNEADLQDADIREKRRRTRLSRLEELAITRNSKDVIKWVERNQSAKLEEIELQFERIQ